jgi:hypothetical protein
MWPSQACSYGIAGGESRSVLPARKAKKIAIGAKIIEKNLLVRHDLHLFSFADKVDNKGLLSNTLFERERKMTI